MTTAARVNSPAEWDRLRFREQMPSPAPTYQHRIGTLLTILNFSLRQAPGPAAVLDIGAGSGQIGRYGRLSAENGSFPPFDYHATEQSAPMREVIKLAVPDASVAVWSFGNGDGITAEKSLARTLEEAADTFSRDYPVVLLSHVLEHVEDYYGLLDEAWSFVKPGGFLVVCVPRMDEHRSHHTTWNWDRLLAVLRQYSGEGVPIGCWECASWADLFCAVPKPALHAVQAQAPARAVVHADTRLQGGQPIGLDLAAHTPTNGKAAA